ncbi:hypothetical protein F4780DRAFT_774356 [Xylariomycetidae sp. FL0641]|nr:hypothetical protein F4780DRAFT_774356 [Xylariomycetidae sp. FL0641]
MASGKFVDPMTLLRLAPVISSTCSLWFSLDQQLFVSALITPSRPPHSSHHNNTTNNNDRMPANADRFIHAYFHNFFWAGTLRVVGLLGATFWTSVALRWWSPPSSSRPWHVAGAALAAAHLLFVPLVAPHVRDVMDDGAAKAVDESDAVRAWLRVHAVRTFTVDLAAWACCVVAAAKAFA